MNDSGLLAQLEELHPLSYGWTLHCCSSNPNEAEDILQITYQKILEGRARYDGRSAFKTWLFAVIRNTAASEQRGRRVRELMLFRFARQWLSESHEQPSHSEDEEPSNFQNAFAQLARRQREVLHLVFYQNMTIEAAATAMGVSLGSARTHYKRGKLRLADLLRNSKDHGKR